MIINHKILSIPPYISTSWSNVTSIHVEGRGTDLILVVYLIHGGRIEIPGLERPILEAIFTFHAKNMEGVKTSPGISNISLGFSGLPGMENFEGLLQHNPEQAHADPLPEEVLAKIRLFSKSLGIDSSLQLPKPEPHCNCPFCQVSKAMKEDESILLSEKEEEEISDADLSFRTWDIKQIGENLYTATNPLDTNEYYQVYLGNPVGCTCGTPHCEHIRTVLMSN